MAFEVLARNFVVGSQRRDKADGRKSSFFSGGDVFQIHQRANSKDESDPPIPQGIHLSARSKTREEGTGKGFS